MRKSQLMERRRTRRTETGQTRETACCAVVLSEHRIDGGCLPSVGLSSSSQQCVGVVLMHDPRSAPPNMFATHGPLAEQKARCAKPRPAVLEIALPYLI